MIYTKAEIKEKDSDSFTAIASTEAVDRHGEVVKVDGWDLKSYKENPILLLMHDHSKPLGKATRVWIEKASGKPKLMFKGMISTATDYGRAAKQLMEEGILSTFSVGFKPLEMEGSEIIKSELYEISLVSVPANREARLVAMKSLQDAGFKDDIVKGLLGEDEVAELKEELKRVTEIAEQAKETAELAVKGLQHLAPHRSKPDVAAERLKYSKVIARTADKLLSKNVSSNNAASMVKVIKKSSEKLIRSHKGDLNGTT